MTHKKSLLLLTVLILAITFRCELNAESKSQPLIHYIKQVSAKYTRAVDGDTIIVNIAGVKERVRLIGVDTPETKHRESQFNTSVKKPQCLLPIW